MRVVGDEGAVSTRRCASSAFARACLCVCFCAIRVFERRAREVCGFRTHLETRSSDRGTAAPRRRPRRRPRIAMVRRRCRHCLPWHCPGSRRTSSSRCAASPFAPRWLLSRVGKDAGRGGTAEAGCGAGVRGCEKKWLACSTGRCDAAFRRHERTDANAKRTAWAA